MTVPVKPLRSARVETAIRSGVECEALGIASW